MTASDGYDEDGSDDCGCWEGHHAVNHFVRCPCSCHYPGRTS